MKTQNNLEELIKNIHLLVSESPHVKGNPNQVVIDKAELFSYLEQISLCMYNMLDEYKLTTEHRKEQERRLKDQEEKMVSSARQTVEDMYSASTLYTDSAIGRMVRILEESQKSFDHLYADFNRRMTDEKNRLRGNQKELEEQLFEMRDSNLYMNILADVRRQLEQSEQKGKKTKKSATTPVNVGTGNFPQPEIKINQAYFDQMGLNADGTKKVDEVSEATAAPEIIVNTNANYFKWKNGEEINDPLVKKKGGRNESRSKKE